jgi:hypothetical protein
MGSCTQGAVELMSIVGWTFLFFAGARVQDGEHKSLLGKG